MICPFCVAVIEGWEQHLDWHRETGTAKGNGIVAIPSNAALLGEPPILCFHCTEYATWYRNEDCCCDEHIVTSTGYID